MSTAPYPKGSQAAILERYLLGKVGARKEFPFGPDAAVFKVDKKMFALMNCGPEPYRITLKCLPEDAEALRSMHEAIAPGYHMNKRHWNTITLDGSLPLDLLQGLINTSYDLVVAGLPKAARHKLQA